MIAPQAQLKAERRSRGVALNVGVYLETGGKMMSVRGFLLISVAAASLSVPALAQQAESGATEGEITVTARRQADLLIDVPDSISVIGEETLVNTGVFRMEDIVQSVPNVVAMQGIKPGFITLTARGISTTQENEAPIAVMVDGVVMPALDFINQDFYDLKQVEVLRGPQGSLYGANAIAGAINITTKAPTNDLEGKLKLAYGNGDYKAVNAVLSGPIVEDRIFFRFAGGYRDEDGTLRNAYDDSTVDFYRELALRGQLEFRPTETLTIDVRGTYVDTHAGAIYNELTQMAVPSQINDFDTIRLDYNSVGVDDRELGFGSVKVAWEAPWGGTLTSVTSFGKTVDAVVGEGDWLPTVEPHLEFPEVPPEFYDLLQDWKVTTRAWNQELRYAGEIGDWLTYQIGGFYQERKRRAELLYGIAEDRVINTVFLEQDGTSRSKLFALFGQADANLTDNLVLTLGLRYDSDKRSYRSAIPVEDGGPTPISDTFKKLQPKASIAYHWSDQFTTYATVARGFRSGGFNDSDAVVMGTLYPRRYESEVLDSYEAGFKASLADGRVSIAGAVYHSDFSNPQFFFPTIQGQILTNFDSAKVDGAELEFTGRVAAGLTVSAAYGISIAEIQAADETGAFKGNRLPRVNSYTLNAGIEYSAPVAGDIELLARADYERRGPMYWDVANTLRTGEKDYLNLRLGLKTESWSIVAFGRNVTNTRQPVEVIQDFPPIGLGANVRRPNLKRRYGVELSYMF